MTRWRVRRAGLTRARLRLVLTYAQPDRVIVLPSRAA